MPNTGLSSTCLNVFQPSRVLLLSVIFAINYISRSFIFSAKYRAGCIFMEQTVMFLCDALRWLRVLRVSLGRVTAINTPSTCSSFD